MKPVFRVATPSRWKDVETLFGERGACAGCWCMLWRLPRRDWEAGKGAGNRRSLRRVVTAGERPGVLAYDGRDPVGWCAIAPRSAYPALSRSRVMKPVDDQPVWSISCLFVLRPYRRQGLSVLLLEAATDFAGKRGARIVEGYPVEPRKGKESPVGDFPGSPDAFLWTGTASAFRQAGFKEVARRSETRPIMRRHAT